MANFNKKPAGKPFKKPNVKPYNELSEAERIAEGTRPIFARTPDFKKTPAERDAWRKVHSNKKGPTSALPRSKRVEIPHLFSVQLKNVKKLPNEEFKSTHTFKAKESELKSILYTFFAVGNNDISEQEKPVIVKCYFNCRQYHIE